MNEFLLKICFSYKSAVKTETFRNYFGTISDTILDDFLSIIGKNETISDKIAEKNGKISEKFRKNFGHYFWTIS